MKHVIQVVHWSTIIICLGKCKKRINYMQPIVSDLQYLETLQTSFAYHILSTEF